MLSHNWDIGVTQLKREHNWVPTTEYEIADVVWGSYSPFLDQGNRIKVRLILRRVAMHKGPLLDRHGQQ